MSNVEKLMCVTCTSSFFYMQRAEQYLQGGYGTAEFRSTSNAPKTILVCIGCGTPVTPKSTHYGRGTAADLAEQDLRKSVEAGQKWRKANSIQNVANITASASEVQNLRELVDDIQKAVKALEKPKAPKAKQSVNATTVGA